jgi:hypothetical protein
MKRLFFILFLVCGLSFTLFAAPSTTTTNVNLIWDYNFITNAEVNAFRLYYGVNTNINNWDGTNIVSRIYTNFISVGTTTNATITNLARGFTYYFGVTALSTNGLESDYSNEAIYIIPKKPLNPKNLTIIP